MKYLIGICDDEKGTCAEIENYICDFFDNSSNTVETLVWYDAETCLRDIEKYTAENIKINILFMDIELPNKDGINLGGDIRNRLNLNNLHIVFISSKSSYAMELFKIHPYDFLIKPIKSDTIYDVLSKILLIDETDQRYFNYSFNKVIYNVPVGTIVYIESRGRKVCIHTSDMDVKEYNGKLKNALKDLPGQFVMTNQSYIVNLKYVIECGSDHVKMLTNERISITSKYRKNFRESLQSYNRGGGVMRE